jgi:hypothetical protein
MSGRPSKGAGELVCRGAGVLGAAMRAKPEFPAMFPIIVCPKCSRQMRFSHMEPAAFYDYRIAYDCDCGFEYRQSKAAAAERHLRANLKRFDG